MSEKNTYIPSVKKCLIIEISEEKNEINLIQSFKRILGLVVVFPSYEELV